MTSPQGDRVSPQQLLDWYDKHARDLPWRIGPGDKQHGQGRLPDPYAVWLSEIMLQQTTTTHAAPYYQRFLSLWPSVDKLAAAPLEDVTREWAGLGYYARARNLHKCAGIVAEMGGFPKTAFELQKLPGIGPYTSAAIAAIAFGEAIAPVDGNIERVISRVYAIAGEGTARSWKEDKEEIKRRVQELVPEQRPGDFAQALMDLGATVCTPKSPSCLLCPWNHGCLAKAEHNMEGYPAKPKKKPQPLRTGDAFVLVCGDEVLLERRPPQGLLGGMLMPPSSPWTEQAVGASPGAETGGEEARFGPSHGAPVDANWRCMGQARHVFTHFVLQLTVWIAYVQDKQEMMTGTVQTEWVSQEDMLESGVPTVGKKVLRTALL